MKALKGLKNLEISLDILVETGVGKIVNSLRKHDVVGDLAKSLVRHWKKLVPEDVTSTPTLQKHNTNNEKGPQVKNTRLTTSKKSMHFKKPQTSQSNCNISFPSDKSKKAQTLEKKQNNEGSGSFSRCKSQCNSEARNDGTCKDSSGDLETSDRKNICKASDEQETPLEKATSSVANSQCFNRNHLAASSRKDFLLLDIEKSDKDPPTKQMDTGLKGTRKSNSVSQSLMAFQNHSMSFESYLNYDQVSQKRRKRNSCPTNRRAAKGPTNSESWKLLTKGTAEEGEKVKSEELLKTWNNMAKASLQDLLNIPLPKVLPELSMPSPPYAPEFKAPPSTEKPPKENEATQLTLWRRNSKMQVYFGSKLFCLSKMLTLYEQCIHVLQNNIDSLYEVGGVPFEILEPVLACCTPEQLLRIEKLNPTFVKESDHLWKKHCQNYFRNEQHLQDESWREMYLRVFVQREEKLKSLTKSIISAQSEKHKGRRVKITLIHGVTKPPRNVHHQQIIYGTSGLGFQLQPKSKNLKKQERSKTSSVSKKSSNISSTRPPIYRNVPTEVVKKPLKSWQKLGLTAGAHPVLWI
ncbi:elongin-A-like isoform X2 [Anolis carolinensis]|uniref:elongin-A-like isoform X2 n=1 Tax=Anolis carolinensis TaxID=28377 RepID=UPI002F2B55BE